MSSANRPDRTLVERIAREEAAAAGVSFTSVLEARSALAVCARRRALRRIKRETGCSLFGLAAVFGCDHGAVLDALREPDGPPPPTLLAPPTGFRTPFDLARRPSVAAALACLSDIDRYQGMP